MATMILLPGELNAALCEKTQGMVESPQLYFEVPENILEFIYSVHKGTLTPFLRNRSHKAGRKKHDDLLEQLISHNVC